jgi:ribosome-associated protein
MILEKIAEQTSRELALNIAEAADDRKAGDIVVLNVGEISFIADYFVILTGYSRTQVKAIADAIDEKLSQEYHREPIGIEGKNDATWIVQDYGDVIVHIFMPNEREFYNLEAFWGHAPRVEFSSVN